MKQNKYKILLFVIASFIVLNTKSQVVVNEYSVSNLDNYIDNYDKFEDWIELYNAGNTIVEIGGYYLSDKNTNPTKWQIPFNTTIHAGEHIIFWASGRDEVKNGHYHTNFKLSQTKQNVEYIVLANPEGDIINELQLEITQLGHSRGRSTDGGENWVLYKFPSAGENNGSGQQYIRYADKPVMNLEAGFYNSNITVTISTNESDSEIRYTIDGAKPSESSSLYVTPIEINETTVIKAKVFSNLDEVLPSLIEFNTYFINENHQLPVISVTGNEIEELLNGNQYLMPFGSFEFFNQQKVRTTFGYGEFNKHGQDSWVNDQRSIDYITRDECGYNYTIQEKLFSLSEREEFQRIILRAAGDDNYPGIDTSAHMRDMFIQKLANKMDLSLDVRKAERFVLYANGIYWGIYSSREKVDDHDFTDFYYDQGKYDLQFLMLWGETWAEYGGEDAFNDWEELYNFITTKDLSDSINYRYVISQYDEKSLVDYIIINSYVVCSDWLNWNVGWWRGKNRVGEHQKWGYILWDEDATFGHYINYTGIPAQSPYVEPCYPEDLDDPWSDPEGHITVLNNLMENEDFYQYYVSRYIDLMNTGFACDSMINMLDSIAAVIESEIPKHTERWGGSTLEWQLNIQKLRDFITTRCNYISIKFY